MRNILLLSGFMLFSSSSVMAAPGFISMSDVSKLKYQLAPDGKIYFRNLNEFNPEATGCCYAYYLDVNDEFGKAAWSTVLMKMATKTGLSIRVSELKPPASGSPAKVDYMGNW